MCDVTFQLGHGLEKSCYRMVQNVNVSCVEVFVELLIPKLELIACRVWGVGGI